jgi:hypothetical protein
MSAAVLRVWVHTQPQQQRYHLEATRAGCEMQKRSSGKLARREEGLPFRSIDHEANQSGAAGLNHTREHSGENRRPGRQLRRECEGFMIMAGGNCADRVVQNALLSPARG